VIRARGFRLIPEERVGCTRVTPPLSPILATDSVGGVVEFLESLDLGDPPFGDEATGAADARCRPSYAAASSSNSMENANRKLALRTHLAEPLEALGRRESTPGRRASSRKSGLLVRVVLVTQ
jgi:hypothetical protein